MIGNRARVSCTWIVDICFIRVFVSSTLMYLGYACYHVDHVVGSLVLISDVAAHVNESIRQVDNFKKLIEVQKKLIGDTGGSLISPSRVS